MKKQLRVLVTGATGFVGSHIVESLAKQDNVECVIACRDADKLPFNFNGEIREGDLLDAQYLQTLVQGIDMVCHAAAWTALWGHKQTSEERFLTPTLNLIAAAQKAGVKKFIFTSSTSVAAPSYSADAMHRGIERKFWPHLVNVLKIENQLREAATDSFKVVNLRLGLFVGNRYGIGLLPILLPRLKTHLVPWVQSGKTHLPLIDGRDIGQAFTKAALAENMMPFESINIVGKNQPTVREMIEWIHHQFGYPKPHFSVNFTIAYAFAWVMEKIDPVVPWEPLVTRSMVHLLEETQTDNLKAKKLLGYEPQYDWQDSVRQQIEWLQQNQNRPMSMTKPI